MTPTAKKRPPALYTHLQLYEKLPAVNELMSLALVLCVQISFLSALLTCGTVYQLLLILVSLHSVHLSDRFNV